MDATHDTENEPLCEYLAKRAGRYYYRRRIPDDLSIYYGNKAEFSFSLHTADRAEAKRRVHEQAAKHDREFAEHRQRLATLSPRDRELDEFARWVENPDAFPAFPPSPCLTPAQEYQQHLYDEEWAREQAMQEARQEAALEIVRDRLAAQREAVALQQEIERLIREDADSDNPEGFEELLGAPPAVRQGTVQGGVLPDPLAAQTQFRAVIDAWARERLPAQKTISRVRSLFAEFEAVIGVGHIEAVTKRNVVAYKNYLLEKSNTPANTRTKLNMIGAVFGYATRQLIVQSNPTDRIMVVDKRRPQEKRQPFDEAALMAIFSSPVFKSGVRPKAGSGDAAYWLPILALYTGARLEELGQLHPEDVHQEDDVWVIRIGENFPGQGVKNDGSIRRIPIHDDVLRLGFVDFVNEAKAAGRQRIFHLLKSNSAGVETANWSKWFGRYLRKDCAVNDERMVFHSFRHSFKRYARECGVPEDVHDALTGHTNGAVARDYGGSYPLKPLADAINSYKIPVFINGLLFHGKRFMT